MRPLSWSAAAALTVFACGPPTPVDAERRPVPDLALQRVDGNGQFALADHKGTVLLVDLWATWCGPCLAELPHLQKLADSYDSKEFLMIGIVLESGGREEIQEFIRKQGISYPNLMGEDGTKEAFGSFLGYPTKYLIDKDGVIVKKYFGVVGDRLREDLELFLRTGALAPAGE